MLTKAKFEDLLSKIDSELSEKEIDFHQRPLQALFKLYDFTDCRSPIRPLSKNATTTNDYSSNALSTQVHRWYERRYGNRIKKHLGPGSYILLIKNEAWEVVYPQGWGNINFTIDSRLSNEGRFNIEKTGKRIPSVNILCHVNDMTTEIANSLTLEEKETILWDYLHGLNAIQYLRDIKNAPYMEQAKNDYDVSVSNIFNKNPDYNNSKWAALMFAEKSIKSKLRSSNIDFKPGHNLTSLANRLHPINIKIPQSTIDDIQCSPKVRYGEELVSRKEAIKASRSALDLFTHIFQPSSYSYK